MYATKNAKLAAAVFALATGAHADMSCNEAGDNIGAFNIADAEALYNSIQTNNIHPSPGTEFLLEAGNQQNFYEGGAKVCVMNPWLFENTHISLGDVGYATNYMINACGAYGGHFLIQGDSGLNIDVYLQPLSGSCAP
ncbi:hypothetical protein NQ176_g2084 [Zarea fungicola]|uniref:Uncharacterized protein n=1 Tax=Zarea fungicola TaxID=93591 RepID=A0ACC1NPZ9_9HYPO|nr:hypothetical protein NQ176_g2084 [Lecanicillium fungicola]